MPGDRRASSATFYFFCGFALAFFYFLYARALSYPPVFDDFANVFYNRAIRYLIHPRIFWESEFTRSRPLPYVTFAISYWFSGFSLSSFRLWSVLLHLGNSILVGLLYSCWWGKRKASWGALGASLLFLFHPIAADSVIYLSARGSLLVLFFLLLALLFHSQEVQGLLSWAGFLLCGILAFLSRESASALPLVLLLSHFQLRRRHTELFPYLAPMLLGALFLLAVKSNYLSAAWRGYFSIQGEAGIHSISEYILLSVSLWPKILALFFSPWAQSLDHQIVAPASWLESGVLAGFLMLGCLIALSLRFFLKRSSWIFPISWFLFSLIPTNSIFPLLDPFAERHFYLALPSFAWLFGMALDSLKGRRVFPVLSLVFVLAFFFTLPRIFNWRSASELWLDAHRKAPSKFRVAFNTASALMEERGDQAGAIRAFWATLELLPPGSLRYEEQNLGLGLLVSAVQDMAKQRDIASRELWQQLGLGGGFWAELILLRADLQEKSPIEWEKEWIGARARVGNPPLASHVRDARWVDHSFLLLKSEFLRQSGRPLEALRLLEMVILPFGKEHFPFWTARESLGDLYMQQGRESEALEQYELAARQYKVFKRFPLELHRKLQAIFLAKGDVLRASDALGELLRVHTDDYVLRASYADLLSKRKNKNALRHLEESEFYRRFAISQEDEREQIRP